MEKLIDFNKVNAEVIAATLEKNGWTLEDKRHNIYVKDKKQIRILINEDSDEVNIECYRSKALMHRGIKDTINYPLVQAFIMD